MFKYVQICTTWVTKRNEDINIHKKELFQYVSRNQSSGRSFGSGHLFPINAVVFVQVKYNLSTVARIHILKSFKLKEKIYVSTPVVSESKTIQCKAFYCQYSLQYFETFYIKSKNIYICIKRKKTHCVCIHVSYDCMNVCNVM